MTPAKRPLLWLVATAVTALGLYLLAASLLGRAGFPLDDAWIHQTYARNLARDGRWQFVPGASSAGSTSPLWTLLLAVGYVLHLPYLWWAYFLGGFCLLGLGWVNWHLWPLLWPAHRDKALPSSLVLMLVWPLLWAAASGMESLLFALLGLVMITLYSRQPEPDARQTAVLGLLFGLLILTRPEGLLLGLLIAAGLFLQAKQTAKFTLPALFFLVALLPLLPYFYFNLTTSGTLWPNTLYAKQAEYAALLTQPLPSRFLHLLFFSLGGPAQGWQGMSSPHLLLLPGWLMAVYTAVRGDLQQRRLFWTLPLLWAGGHVFLYAWKLPVTYQYGRYLFPILPIWVLYGLSGWHTLWQKLATFLPDPARLRLFRFAGNLTFLALLAIFFGLGLQAYANDVAFIEGEMVNIAHWIAENTPPDALIASHDIGAIGYFSERPLLDLAGLITPEVIPLLNDEAKLSNYVLHSPANYLVTAPGWTYPLITATIPPRYTTNYGWTREQGMNNMTIYPLQPPAPQPLQGQTP